MKCKDSINCEKYLIKLFKEKFIQKTYYGTEYFEGNEDEMINEIYKYLYTCNTTTNKINEKDLTIESLKNLNNDANKDNNSITNNESENSIKIAMEIAMNKNINKSIDKIIEKDIVKSEKIKDKIKENVKTNKNIINKDTSKICPNCNYEFKFPSLLKTHFRKSYHCLLSEDKINDFFYKCSLSVNQCNKCNHNFKNRQALLRHNRETKCGKTQYFSNNKDTIINNLTNIIIPELAKDILTIIINKKKS